MSNTLDLIRDTLSVTSPFIISLFILFIPFIIGIVGGYKRALYWGFGNLILLMITYFIWIIVGNYFDSFVYEIIKPLIDPNISKDSIMPIIELYSCMVFYLLIFILGNIILLICWYTFAKRWLLLTKDTRKDNYSKKYKVLSSLSGCVISLCLFSPVVVDLQSMTFTMLSSQSNLSKTENKYADGYYDLINYCHMLNPFRLWDNGVTNLDGVEILYTSMNNNEEYLDPMFTIFSRDIISDVIANGAQDVAIDLKNNIDNISLSDMNKLNIIFGSPSAIDILLSEANQKTSLKKVTEVEFINEINLLISAYNDISNSSSIKISTTLEIEMKMVKYFSETFVTSYTLENPTPQLKTTIEEFIKLFFIW